MSKTKVINITPSVTGYMAVLRHIIKTTLSDSDRWWAMDELKRWNAMINQEGQDND